MDTIEIIESFIREYYLYGAIITPIITVILVLYYDDATRQQVLKEILGLLIVTALFLMTSMIWFVVLPSIIFMGVARGSALIIERIKNPPTIGYSE